MKIFPILFVFLSSVGYIRNFSATERLEAHHVEVVAKLPQVEAVDANLGFQIYSDVLKAPFENHGNHELRLWDVAMSEFYLVGIGAPDFTALKNVSIMKGRNFSEDEISKATDVIPVLISKQMAKLNQLKLGSKFSLDNYFFDYEQPRTKDMYEAVLAKEVYDFEVVGIFEGPSDFAENCVLVPEYIAEQAIRFHHRELYGRAEQTPEILAEYEYCKRNLRTASALFRLKDGAHEEDFVREAGAILPEGWEVEFGEYGLE